MVHMQSFFGSPIQAEFFALDGLQAAATTRDMTKRYFMVLVKDYGFVEQDKNTNFFSLLRFVHSIKYDGKTWKLCVGEMDRRRWFGASAF